MYTKIWAHRGASAYAPENTLSAFDLAIKQNADGIELDVHLSKDNRVIVTHDDDALRVTGYNGLIKDLTLEEIKKLSFDNGMAAYIGERAPTLEEVVDLVKPSNLLINIELKTNHDEPKGLEEACMDIVKKANMEKRIIYSSFNHKSLMHMKKINPDAILAILFANRMYNDWKYAKSLGCQAIHPHHSSIYGEKYIKLCHEMDIICNTWTVDDPKKINSLLSFGIDGIITNKPDLGVKLRDEHIKNNTA